MFRFLRRVFILLVLFVIIFLVFRFVKPEATNRFVDKVKWIPTTISSRFHREKKSEIVINWNTTSTSSNFEVNGDDEYYEWSYNPEIDENKNENDNETDNKNDKDINDSSRLEELNRELDKIIASGDNQSQWYDTDSDVNWDLEEIISWVLGNNESNTDVTWNSLPTWFNVVDVEQPHEQETQTQTTTQNTNTTNTQDNPTTQTNNKQSNTQQKRWDCGEWLTVQDCEQMKRDFWNYN